MVTKKIQLTTSVIEEARQRIIRAFDNGVKVYMGMSGGKDSVTLAHLTHQLIREGRIDAAQLTVDFIDEEAIFGEIERIVRHWRSAFIAAGARFRWFCIEVKHFNCFNQLVNDESFICWDSTRRDVWCRPMPSFAITDHPLLRRRVDRFQQFLPRVEADGIRMAGVRVAESIQRLNSFHGFDDPDSQLFAPLYDWKDTDIWRYIRDEEVDFPETYLHLYQTGSSRRQMRLSQFFSIDTARSLVKMGEYEPDLMDRIVAREPNAYLAALYWDTEMFRHSGGQGEARGRGSGEEEQRDWKGEVLKILSDPTWPARFPDRETLHRLLRRVVVRNHLTRQLWRMAHEILSAGDPKMRNYRALLSVIATTNRKNYERHERLER